MKIINNFLFLPSIVFFACINGMDIAEPPIKNCWDLSKKLYDNIATLDINQLKKFVDEGATVAYPKAGKKPILMFTLNDCQKTKFLLDNGANLDQPYKGRTTLKVAMQQKKCNLSLIKLLLTYNPQDKCLSTLVHKNSPRLANLFIDEGYLSQDGDLAFCIYESLDRGKMRVAHLFMKAYPHYQIALNFRLACESNKLNKNQAGELFAINQCICSLPDEKFAELKKDFDPGTELAESLH